MRTPRPAGSIVAALSLSAVTLAAMLVACSGRAAAPVAAVTVKFADVPGIRAELKALRGRPVLLNFWATWCGPCVEELPALGKFARQEGANGPGLLGVSLDAWVFGEGRETEEKVREALADAGVPYANLIYEGDQDPLASAFEIPGGIPYSILYDAGGRRVRAWAGTIEIPELRDALATLK